MDEFDTRNAIELLVDYLYRELDGYEVSLYVYLLRKSVMLGKSNIRIGKRTLQSEFVHGKRGAVKRGHGGLWVNYKHITGILNSLRSKGCIEIGNTTMEGTLYIVREPRQVPFVIKALAASKDKNKSESEDYFHDPVKRREIFERDGWRCQYCGDPVDETNATLDHYIPQSRGGSHDKSNLRTCCLLCNSIKTGRTFEEAAPQLLKASLERRAKVTT